MVFVGRYVWCQLLLLLQWREGLCIVLVEESVLSLQRIFTFVTQVLVSALYCQVQTQPTHLFTATECYTWTRLWVTGKCLHLDPTCQRNWIASVYTWNRLARSVCYIWTRHTKMKSILNQPRRKFTIPKTFKESDEFSKTLPYTLSFAIAVFPSFPHRRNYPVCQVPYTSVYMCATDLNVRGFAQRWAGRCLYLRGVAACAIYRVLCGFGTSTGI